MAPDYAFLTPENESRTLDLPAACTISFIVFYISRDPSTEALTHCRDRLLGRGCFEIHVERPGVIGNVVFRQTGQYLLHEANRVAGDKSLSRGVRLCQEEKIEVVLRDCAVRPLIKVESWNDVHDGKPLDLTRMIQGQAPSDACAAIMAHECKALEAKFLHDSDLLCCHLPLAVGPMVRLVPWLVAFATPTYVGEDDSEMVSKLRRNSVPAKMRLWVAMKHKERWAGTADQRPNSPLCCSDHTSLEARQELAVHVLKGCHAAKSDTL